MADRAQDWYNQAARDLAQAVDSRKAGRHEWACFAAQQAAEKAAKAFRLSFGQKASGQMVAQLLCELPAPASIPQDMVEKGKVLDNFYIPTRYPIGHPSGSPFEHYGSIQSEQALQYASEILEFVRLQMAGS